MAMNVLSDGTFVHAGQGQKGDMTFDTNDPNGRNNTAIRDHQGDNRSIHVFETDSIDDTVLLRFSTINQET